MGIFTYFSVSPFFSLVVSPPPFHSLSLSLSLSRSLSCNFLSSFLVFFLSCFLLLPCFCLFVSLHCSLVLCHESNNIKYFSIRQFFFINPFCFSGFLFGFVFQISFLSLLFPYLNCVFWSTSMFLSFKKDELKNTNFW